VGGFYPTKRESWQTLLTPVYSAVILLHGFPDFLRLVFADF
jgi:hypothetical protein